MVEKKATGNKKNSIKKKTGKKKDNVKSWEKIHADFKDENFSTTIRSDGGREGTMIRSSIDYKSPVGYNIEYGINWLGVILLVIIIILIIVGIISIINFLF